MALRVRRSAFVFVAPRRIWLRSVAVLYSFAAIIVALLSRVLFYFSKVIRISSRLVAPSRSLRNYTAYAVVWFWFFCRWRNRLTRC